MPAQIVIETSATAPRRVAEERLGVLVRVHTDAVVLHIGRVQVAGRQRDPGAVRGEGRQRHVGLRPPEAVDRIGAHDTDPAVIAKRLPRAKAGGEPATGVDRIEHRIDTAGFAGDPPKVRQAVDDSFSTVQRWRRHRGLLVRLLLADGLGPGLLGHRLARLDQPHRGGREQCGSAHLRARPVADRGKGRSTVAVDRQLAGSMMIESVGCAFHDPR